MDLGLAGDAAVVAASSAGLGRASAKALAEEGADVVVNGRDRDRLEAAAGALRETAAGAVVPVAGDLREPATAEALVSAAVEEFGGLDHLVTNAGGPPSGAFVGVEEREWREHYELLVGSAVRLCRHAEEPLRAGEGGTVVAITSKSVKEAVDRLVLSNALRPGVVGLVKTLSREWAPSVRANVVMPGSHATGRIATLIAEDVERGTYDSRAEGEADWVADVPLGRMGEPDRLGQVVAFLCSEPASYFNGAALMVDGGASRSIL